MKKFFIILLAVMLFAASCRKTDEYLPLSPQEDAVYYQTVPYSITVGITPIADKMDGVEWKSTFYEGDFIQITNSQLLTEPAILTSDDCIGKDKATFSGNLKVKLGKTLTSGSTNLTAVLKNSDTAQHLYNDGRPFIDVKEVESNTEGLNRYSYWTCEGFTYNANAAEIDLEQKTIFVKFEMPYGGVKFSMSSDNAFSSDVNIVKDKLYAVPYGMVLKSDILNLEKKLDEKGVCVYKINYPTPPNCLPGIFSVSDFKQVYFSKGNLQNNNTIWQLAPNQYDVPQSYNGEWLGQFAWYSGEWYQGNYGNDGFSDFQCVLGPQWSLLSFKEWNYLFYQRPNAAEKYGVATVAGLEGVILLPDDWSMTDGFALSSNYSEEEWTQMENAGAVFLPMEGDYSFYYDSYPNTSKFKYWTSSATSYNLISLALESGYVGLTTKEQNRGAVRLVYNRGIYTPVNSVTPIKPTSEEDRCIVVEKGDGDYADFYLCTHGFIKGQKYKLSMKVKADYNDEFDNELMIRYTPDKTSTGNITPSYSYPETGQVSDYLRFSTEWETVELTGKFDANGWVIGFELDHPNKFYFDDIKLTIDDMEVIANGDCSSDDTRSFAVVNDYLETIPVTFIDKKSIKNIEPGTVIFEIDYTTLDEYPYYDHASNYELDSENGLILFDDKKNRVAEDIPTLDGKYYSIIVEIRGDEAGELEASMHWNSYSYPIKTTIQYGTEWETREFFFDEPVEGDCFMNFENSCPDQTVYIRNIKVAYQGD